MTKLARGQATESFGDRFGISPSIVAAASKYLREGGIILHPTETVYGLAGDPSRAETVARVNKLKSTAVGKPLLVLTDEWERVADWLATVSEVHSRLMARHELPITIVFDASEQAPRHVVSASNTIGIRRTSSPFCRDTIAHSGLPLFSTSANRSGQPAPSRFQDIEARFVKEVDLAVDGGQTLAGQPSTVVSIAGRTVKILRPGAITEEEILQVLI